MKYIILCSSITYAMKGQKLLLKRGISCGVGRPSPQLGECGCGYSLEINQRDKDRALPLLYEYKIRIKGIYTQSEDGEIRAEQPCKQS